MLLSCLFYLTPLSSVYSRRLRAAILLVRCCLMSHFVHYHYIFQIITIIIILKIQLKKYFTHKVIDWLHTVELAAALIYYKPCKLLPPYSCTQPVHAPAWLLLFLARLLPAGWVRILMTRLKTTFNAAPALKKKKRKTKKKNKRAERRRKKEKEAF